MKKISYLKDTKELIKQLENSLAEVEEVLLG